MNESKILLMVFCMIYFPFWGNLPRFLLLGTYMVILALILADNRYRSWYFLLYYVGFTFAFSSLKHITSFQALIGNSVNFCHVDFDAYQILMCMIKYTDECGVAFGKNIISAILFLLPRSIWKGKMISSGALAVSYYGSWFTNVSAPLFGELYFACGWIGVIFGNILTAKISAVLDSWSSSKKIMKRGTFCIFSGMTIYICRGALLVAISYTLGLVLSLLVMSKMAKIDTQ